MKCLIIDVVSPAIAEELGKYMEVDTKILPTYAVFPQSLLGNPERHGYQGQGYVCGF